MGMLAVMTMTFLLGLPEQDMRSDRDAGEHATREVEQHYALRERDSGPLEEFRGGDNLEALIYLGIIIVGAAVVFLYLGIVALVQAAS
ncbi:MAG TPA: hypothetical protein VNM14_12385 [Planctomycetota bacterium]|jgi:hypothetical protein|nr:hypothetical protein [Planctomycetota bacterium]